MVDYTKVAVDAAKREMYGAQTAAADAARRGINGPIRDGVQVAREGLKRFMEGAGSFFSGGIWDTTTAKIGAATVAGGVAVTAAAGTALGGAKTAAETAVGQVADAAVGAAGVAQNFVANAATVTAPPIAAGAEPAPSGERTVSVGEFLTPPAKGGVTIGVTSGVTPKSDFNYAAPGAPLPALEATIEEGGGKFDQATYARARAQIAGIKPSGMG